MSKYITDEQNRTFYYESERRVYLDGKPDTGAKITKEPPAPKAQFGYTIPKKTSEQAVLGGVTQNMENQNTKLNRSLITHYFCIAPQSSVKRGFHTNDDGPLWMVLGEGIGQDMWKTWVGISPSLDTILITDYEDTQEMILSVALHKIGINSDPNKFLPSDPSIFLTCKGITDAKTGSMTQVVLGFAFRIPGKPSFVINSEKPWEIQ